MISPVSGSIHSRILDGILVTGEEVSFPMAMYVGSTYSQRNGSADDTDENIKLAHSEKTQSESRKSKERAVRARTIQSVAVAVVP